MVAREFRIHAGCEKAFELVFGPGGDWAVLLRRSPGYLATELRMVSAERRLYEARDCWKSHGSFELFREVYRSDLEWFRDWLKERDLVEQEIFLGAFYSGEDEDRGDEAVPVE